MHEGNQRFVAFWEWGIGNRIKVALCIFYKADVLSNRPSLNKEVRKIA